MKRQYLEQVFKKLYVSISQAGGWYTEASGAGIHLFIT